MATARNDTATLTNTAAAPDCIAGVPQAGDARQSLTRVLSQSEHIQDLVEECADDLAAVNSALQAELSDRPSQSPALKTALEQSDGIEDKVQDCADDLATVNQALEAEIREREHPDPRRTVHRERQ